MICDCGHDFDDHNEDREFSNCCSKCGCTSCGITQMMDLDFYPNNYYKVSTYNLQETFSYIAVGGSP